LEGLHARTAAVTDARLVEAHVGDYLHFRSREHRWVRGDTHLLPWIFASGRPDRHRPAGRGRAEGPGRPAPAQLSMVERLGLARDLLAHLSPAALTALLAIAWLVAPVDQVGGWTVTILAASAHPIALTSLLPQLLAARAVLTGPGDRGPRRLAATWRRSLPSARRLAAAEAARWLLSLALLADMALVSVDAVIRAGYRMGISHRHVLQWTASSRQGRLEPGLGPRLRRLWPASVLAAGLALAAFAADPARLAWAGPLLLLWLATPLLAYRLSRPARRLPDVVMT
jgi:hypothetical protein